MYEFLTSFRCFDDLKFDFDRKKDNRKPLLTNNETVKAKNNKLKM